MQSVSVTSNSSVKSADKKSVKKEKKTTSKSKKTDNEEVLATEENVNVSVNDTSDTTLLKPNDSTVVDDSTTIQQSVEVDDVTSSHEFKIAKFQELNTFSSNHEKYLNDFNFYVKENFSSFSKDEKNKCEYHLRKMQKNINNSYSNLFDTCFKNISTLEKSSGHKSSVKKSPEEKLNAAIHKKLEVYPYVLTFMNLPDNTMVSRADVLTAITSFVKSEKAIEPDMITCKDDKRSFYIIGKLKTFFDGISNIMKSKNIEEEVPSQIKFTQIMKYMKYCFVKNDTVV